jgi:hypothetical protein
MSLLPILSSNEIIHGQIIRNRLIMQLSIKNPLQIPTFETLDINVLLPTTLFAPYE